MRFVVVVVVATSSEIFSKTRANTIQITAMACILTPLHYHWPLHPHVVHPQDQVDPKRPARGIINHESGQKIMAKLAPCLAMKWDYEIYSHD